MVATSGDLSASVNIAVVTGEVDRIVISWPEGVNLSAVVIGRTVQFSAEGEDEYGNRGEKRRIAISPTWGVSGGIVGTIGLGGLFTATAEGTGQVTASLGDPPVSESVEVAVVPNTPPVASFTVAPTSGDTNTVFQFDASGCSDGQDPASALEVRWDWEDDETYDTAYSTTKTASHQYSIPGTKVVRLQVRDTDGATGSTTRTISVAVATVSYDYGVSSPGELEVDPTRPYLYLAARGQNEVKIISTSDYTEFGSFFVGSAPGPMDISPEGDRLLVGLLGANQVAVVDISDISSPSIVNAFPVSARPDYLVVGNNNKVYFCNGTEQAGLVRLWCLNYLTGEQSGGGNTGGPMAASADRNHLFWVMRHISLTELTHMDISGPGFGTVIGGSAPRSFGLAVACDPVGRYVYASWQHTSGVRVFSYSFNPADDLILQATLPSGLANSLAASPDGNYVYAGGGASGGVVGFDMNTFLHVHTVPGMSSPGHERLKVSSDGTKVYAFHGPLYVGGAYQP